MHALAHLPKRRWSRDDYRYARGWIQRLGGQLKTQEGEVERLRREMLGLAEQLNTLDPQEGEARLAALTASLSRSMTTMAKNSEIPKVGPCGEDCPWREAPASDASAR
ncbi:MAG TPA: hypothetical protein VEA38_15185 [Terriglobales bacterium]|nr:hypothetical protein [Terriglobales bacterium]